MRILGENAACSTSHRDDTFNGVKGVKKEKTPA